MSSDFLAGNSGSFLVKMVQLGGLLFTIEWIFNEAPLYASTVLGADDTTASKTSRNLSHLVFYCVETDDKQTKLNDVLVGDRWYGEK